MPRRVIIEILSRGMDSLYFLLIAGRIAYIIDLGNETKYELWQNVSIGAHRSGTIKKQSSSSLTKQLSCAAEIKLKRVMNMIEDEQ